MIAKRFSLYYFLHIYQGKVVLLKKSILYRKKNIRLIYKAYNMFTQYLQALDRQPIGSLVEKIKNERLCMAWPIEEIVKATMFASRIHPFSKCLDRSLVLATLLRRSGYSFCFNIGLQANDLKQGHAWIEINVDGQSKMIDFYEKRNDLVVAQSWQIE